MAKPVTITLQSQLQWKAGLNPESGRWIAVCDEMNLVMEANSLDELHSLINEAIQILLMDLLRDNELDRYLRERGWKALNVPRKLPADEDLRFDVPWELVARNALDSERRTH